MLNKLLSKADSTYRQAVFPYTPSGLKKKYIFVHIPKAAGTAVRVALGEPVTGRQHLPWWVYEQASPRRFKDFYKFAFVRDPLDRAFSGYSYLKSGGNKMNDLPLSKYLELYNSFDEFVDAELFNGSMIYHPIFRPQSWYLCNWNGEIKVDYVGRFESISRDFKNVVEQLQLNDFSGLQVINSSPVKIKDIGLSARDKIKLIYKDDYKLLYNN